MPARIVETRSRKLRVLQAEREAIGAESAPTPRLPSKPDWIRMKLPRGEVFFDLKQRVAELGPAHRLRERLLPETSASAGTGSRSPS